MLQSCSKPGPTNTDQILDELAAKYKPEDLPEKQAVLNFINNHRKRKDASLKQGQKRTWRIADFEALVARLPDVTDPGDGPERCVCPVGGKLGYSCHQQVAV